MHLEIDLDSFDTRETDRKIEELVSPHIKRDFIHGVNNNHVGILATQLYDTGGHTENIRRLISNLSDKYEFKTFLTKKFESDNTAQNKLNLIKEYSKVEGFDCHKLESITAINLMFNLIIEFAPKVLFVFIHKDDELSVALLAMIKKYTNIKIIFDHHVSQEYILGLSFTDLILAALPSTYYVDVLYRKIDKHYIIPQFSDNADKIKYFSKEEIANKRKKFGIEPDEYLTMSGGDAYKFFEDKKSPYFHMIKRLLTKEPKLKHIIISNMSPQQMGIVDEIIGEMNIKDRLIFIPQTDDYEILFQSCDVFIDSFPMSSALTQIDLMKFKRPTVVKINNDNKLLSFHEYMPKDYPYMFPSVSDMEKGILKLIYDKEERDRIIELNYKHYMENYEYNAGRQKYIDLIENCDKLEQFYFKAEQNILNDFKVFSKAEKRKIDDRKRLKELALIKEKEQIAAANIRLRTAKIAHIMHSEKFDRAFVHMINRNFNPADHIFLCSDNIVERPLEWFPIGDNVFNINDLSKVNLAYPGIEKIICHSIIRNDLIIEFCKNPALLFKSYWNMWGLDLYEANRDKMNDFIRQNFKGYIGKPDEEYAKNKYGMKGKFFDAFYNFPISKEMLDKVVEQPKDYIKIQINNSCDKSTIDMLEVLSKFKDENIKITTIVSYEPYGNTSYARTIVKKGMEIFGDKFESIKTWMKPEQYAQHLAQNDILILCQNKQQGFGNTLASLYLGKKVFIRSDVSVNKYLNSQRIKIYNSDEIKDMNFLKFIEFTERENNCKNIQKYFDEKYLISLWKNIFDDEDFLTQLTRKYEEIELCHKK